MTLPWVRGYLLKMNESNISDPLASPYQSTSHRTSLSRERSGNTKRHSIQQSLRRLRAAQYESPRSLQPGNIDVRQALNAPKPRLQPNEDNVLFANGLNPLSQTKKRLSLFKNEIPIGGQINPHNLGSSQEEAPQTSTPLVLKNDKKERFNFALVGAPRLALNVSIHNSSADSPDPNIFARVESDLNSFNIDGSICSSHSPTNHLLTPKIVPSRVPNVGNCKSSPNNDISNASIVSFQCRICHEDGEMEDSLMSPCRCKGTTGLIHRKCLTRWLIESGKPSCEICGYRYIMVPSKNQSLELIPSRMTRRCRYLSDWTRVRAVRRHLLTDLVCFALLTPSMYLGVYFCAIGAWEYSSDKNSMWPSTGLYILAIFLVCLYIIWMFLVTRHHVKNFKRYSANQRLRAEREAERMSALPKWRFSIQPRPRGSSILHQSEDSQRTLTCPSIQHPTSTSTPDIYNQARNGSNTCDAERAQSTSPRILVSVALSTVPELTEEYSAPSNDPASTMPVWV